jgi:hypothetical protein
MLPERGFEHFFSFARTGDETIDDQEAIAHLFVYLSVAVEQWATFRQGAEQTAGLTSAQCGRIESNVIDVFRGARDAIQTASDTEALAHLSRDPAIKRLPFAFAFLALFAAPETVSDDYRELIFETCPGVKPRPDAFLHSLWQGAQTPDGVRRESDRYEERHDYDGFQRGTEQMEPLLDEKPKLEPLFEPTREVSPFQKALEPINKPATLHMRESTPLTAEEWASLRPKLRALAKQERLKPRELDFLLKMVTVGGNASDSDTARRAIRDRKRERLLPKVQAIIDSLRQSPK